jgi:hypothetical protein
MPLSKAPTPQHVDQKSAGNTADRRETWHPGGLARGGGLTETHIAKDKYFDLTFSYIMGKAANLTNFLN